MFKYFGQLNSFSGLKKAASSKHFIRCYDDANLSSIFNPRVINPKIEEYNKPKNIINPFSSTCNNKSLKIIYPVFNDDDCFTDDDKTLNNNELPNKKSIAKNKFQNVLIWAAGGPASGKTTLLHNMASIMKDYYGLNTDQMLIIGNTLMKSFKLSNKPIIQTLIPDRDPIIIDNHGVNNDDIINVINFAKHHNYRTILIYPWIRFDVFRERLNKRKEEIGRDFNSDLFWQKHQIINEIMRQYIESPNSCPFDVCLIFDNNYDQSKPMIWGKIMDQNYLVDDYIIDKIKYELRNFITNDTRMNIYKHKSEYKFIPKKEYFSIELKNMFNCLFKDLILDNNNFVELNNHFEKLVMDIFRNYKMDESS
jgi:energy-coupling factor transporter ATP-binding protein EcfA2